MATSYVMQQNPDGTWVQVAAVIAPRPFVVRPSFRPSGH